MSCIDEVFANVMVNQSRSLCLTGLTYNVDNMLILITGVHALEHVIQSLNFNVLLSF